MARHPYARVELERRFLLAHLPEPLTPSSPHDVCTDLYLEGMRLRLRSLVPSDGGRPVYKLGQKHRPEGFDADEREMTTFYLTAAEHRFLSDRLGDGVVPLIKRRYPLMHQGLRFVIDAFAGRCAGLFLADLELTDASGLRAAPVPDFAIHEVTSDPRYEGAALARQGPPPPGSIPR